MLRMHRRPLFSSSILGRRSIFSLSELNSYPQRKTSDLSCCSLDYRQGIDHFLRSPPALKSSFSFCTYLDYAIRCSNNLVDRCSCRRGPSVQLCERKKVAMSNTTRLFPFLRFRVRGNVLSTVFSPIGADLRGFCTCRSTPLRHYSVASTIYSSVSDAAQRQRDKEMKENLILEEEEFSQQAVEMECESNDGNCNGDPWDDDNRVRHRFSFSPSYKLSAVLRSLGRYAYALEKERSRMKWVLYERRQLLGDLHGSSIVANPTNMKRVVQTVLSSPSADPLHPFTPSNLHFSANTAVKASLPIPSASSPIPMSPAELLLQSPYLNWKGSSFTPIRVWKKLKTVVRRTKNNKEGKNVDSGSRDAFAASFNAIATITEDLDYLRFHRDLHQLPYYRRLQLTPKRNIWHSLFHSAWNIYIGVMNAFWSVLSYPFLPLTKSCASTFTATSSGKDAENEHSSLSSNSAVSMTFATSVFFSFLQGIVAGMEYLWYGCFVSPVLLLTTGAANSVYGAINFFRGKYMFDALSGRYMKCTVLDSQILRSALQREKRLIRAIGRMEFQRRRLKSEDKWTKRMSSMGFSMENLQEQVMKRKSQHDGRKGGFDGNGSHRMNKGSLGVPKTKKVFNPYEVLHVKRNSPLATIKSQYKKLAMVFHPDVAQSSQRDSGAPLTDDERRQAQERFEEISRAYQILSNREKRRAYDMSGESGLAMHESKYGEFLQRTPEEVVQRLFGGEAFRYLLVGELLRSHWALRYEAQVSVSLHDLEELQCIRVRQIALELAWMTDVHAMAGEFSASPFATSSSVSSTSPHSRPSATARTSSPSASSCSMNAFHSAVKKKKTVSSSSTPSNPTHIPFASQAPPLEPGSNPYCEFSPKFIDRCDAFVARLSDACFGRELMHEVGLAYVVGSQRFLGHTPFYAPKMLSTKKIFSGMDQIWGAFNDKMAVRKDDPYAQQKVARKVMVEYFHMEYGNVVADLHICLRFAIQIVLQDVTVSETVRKKRCYAAWYIGQKMLEKGIPFGAARKDDDDAEMMAYIQQAATSSATVAKPKPF